MASCCLGRPGSRVVGAGDARQARRGTRRTSRSAAVQQPTAGAVRPVPDDRSGGLAIAGSGAEALADGLPLGCGRRGAIRAAVGSGLTALLLSGQPLAADAAPGRQFPTAGECSQRLQACRDQLDGIAAALTSMAEGETDISTRRYRDLQGQLHQGELGKFWTTARCADQYIRAGLPGEKGALARDEADLYSLLPERAGPISKMLKPNWEDPDDPLCLVYSCVNDPGAPPSINMLYALKLLHVGLGIAAGGDKRATPEGLLSNVTDASEKLVVYMDIVDRSGASVPQELLASDGSLAGGAVPPAKADSYGPSPLG